MLPGAAVWAEVAPLLMPSLRMLPEREEEERGASLPRAAAELLGEESRPKEPRRGQGEAAAGLAVLEGAGRPQSLWAAGPAEEPSYPAGDLGAAGIPSEEAAAGAHLAIRGQQGEEGREAGVHLAQ